MSIPSWLSTLCAFAYLASGIGLVGFAQVCCPPSTLVFSSCFIITLLLKFIGSSLPSPSMGITLKLLLLPDFYKTFLNIKVAMGSSLITKYLSRQEVCCVFILAHQTELLLTTRFALIFRINIKGIQRDNNILCRVKCNLT